MHIVETLVPLILIIGLGFLLSKIKFLGRDFASDLNKLAFWVALPALLFISSAHAQRPGRQVWLLLGVLVVATLLICGIGWIVSLLLKMPKSTRGTLQQAAFRGNLAYIGIPVLAYSFGVTDGTSMPEAFSTAVIVMTALMASYNILAVIVLQNGRTSPRALLVSIITNPLLLSGILGLLVAGLGISLPSVLDRSLELVAGAAVPIALLCIGGSLAMTSLQGRKSWIFAAVAMKVALLPLIVWLLATLVHLHPDELRIALVLASCPTAAAAYVMAVRMGGDEALASGSIAASTIASAISLSIVLWVTGT